jgi:IS4 transposase
MFCLSGQKGRDAMRTDSKIGGGPSALIHRHSWLSCISVFLQCLVGVADPAAKRRVRWTPYAASTAAVLMALDADGTLQGRFRHARSCLKGDGRRRRGTGTTYNGLVKALERQETHVLPIVKAELRTHVRRRLKRIDPTSPWFLLAVDGSKEELPRTRDHERVFGMADNGIFPQAFVTTIVEVHTGLPWDWRIDRARASEKKHLMEMTDDLPQDALLLGDGAFVGLPIWSRLNAHGQPFLIRVGGNVRLITDLWPKADVQRKRDIVYVWPQKDRKTRPPLRLRVIKVGGGRKAVHLLTNVLDTRRLPRKMAGAIYRRRWGVELFYRTLKRTLGCAKLRSKAARRARIELEWTLVALTIATLLGIDAIVKRRRDPRRLSPAKLIGTLRDVLRRAGAGRPPTQAALRRALGDSLKDNYHRRRSKQSRHCRTTTNTPNPRLQPPIIRRATAQERRHALRHHYIAAA